MEKENKYYEPEIEEFCVGFECEFKDLSGNFVPMVHTKESIGFADTFRVKYLDEQDIIDCGFVKSTGLYDLKCYNYKDCRIYPDFNEENHYFIKYLSGYFSDSEVQLFAGFIKNKHELKTVLKMIGVYE